MTTDIKPSAATSDTHTPGPWFVDSVAAPCTHNGDIAILNDRRSIVAVAFSKPTDGEAIANARRIVACVNACEKLDTGLLERVGRPGCGIHPAPQGRIEELEQQRDELLALLECAIDLVEDYGALSLKKRAREAINKARGQL